jgi:hypothetical protein
MLKSVAVILRLFGAEFTRVYAEWRGVKPKPESFAQRDPHAIARTPHNS